MQKYRKKPVVVEAVHFNGNYDHANHLLKSTDMKIVNIDCEVYDRTNFDIETLEGTMKVLPGDYVIKGIQGEFYPCKPDIFEATYDKVD